MLTIIHYACTLCDDYSKFISMCACTLLNQVIVIETIFHFWRLYI